MERMAKRTASGIRRMDKSIYEAELRELQSEFITMSEWVKAKGKRLVVLFEGRDAAGKGSAIKRIVQYANPRHVRVAALPVPSDREKTQWYFQRYVAHLPAAGEIVLFDRSWYNRAGVEKVMGYCTQEQYERFLVQAPMFENMLQDDGIILLKYWFSVSDVEQEARFQDRLNDPMRRWKLSPTDIKSLTKWEDYSEAKDAMMEHTDTDRSPWYTVESEDKRVSRINVIAHILSQVPYEKIDPEPVEIPKRPRAKNAGRPPRDSLNYVPDHAAAVAAAAADDPDRRTDKKKRKKKD